jgi:hypothetical protein
MATDRARAARELPVWLWLWFPPLVALVMLVLVVSAPSAHRHLFEHKEGPLEWLTVVVLMPGIAAGILALRHAAAVPWPWFRPFVATCVAAAIYFWGEEMSWGQHLFKWETPEAWHGLNRQRETNLHNLYELSGLLDKLPRTLFELWALCGALVAWHARKTAYRSPWTWQAWVWPTVVCVPAAALAIAIRVPDRIEKLAGDFTHPVLARLRLSEPQEYYFALFLTLFLLSLHARTLALSREAAGAGAYRKSRTAGLPLSSR